MRIAIAGASGFVGRNLVAELARRSSEVIALSRSQPRSLPAGAKWREVDLFSAQSTLAALDGVDIAVYLVHSMLPSTTLFQGNFHDTDILLADNFARACRKRGVRRILYLGGLIPEGHISLHLESRREVESVLRSTGVAVTVFRAGLIVGPGGSSFEMLHSLVRRLPVMLLPRWTLRTTQAVFIDDVVQVLAAAIFDEGFKGQTLDLVNGEPLHYRTLLEQMAEVLGLKRFKVNLPINSTGFSKLWVSLFSSTSYELVSPLIDSLLCDLPASKPAPQVARLIRYPNFRSMARETLHRRQLAAGEETARRPARPVKRRRTVRSIQRLPQLRSRDCKWISMEYMRWLPGAFLWLIHVEADEASGRVHFHLRGVRRPLLELQYIGGDDDADRSKFHIVGGILSATTDTGWLEFRQVQSRQYTLAAIHEFIPRLPWPVYLCTQAILHAWTMKRFGKYLAQAEQRG